MRKIKLLVWKWFKMDEAVKAAFYEGWSMAHDVDPIRCDTLRTRPEHVRNIFNNTRCWRSVDEAWANSDAEECLNIK